MNTQSKSLLFSLRILPFICGASFFCLPSEAANSGALQIPADASSKRSLVPSPHTVFLNKETPLEMLLIRPWTFLMGKSKFGDGTLTGTKRIARGGSYALGRFFCRYGSRFFFEPDYRGADMGFRIVLSLKKE